MRFMYVTRILSRINLFRKRMHIPETVCEQEHTKEYYITVDRKFCKISFDMVCQSNSVLLLLSNLKYQSEIVHLGRCAPWSVNQLVYFDFYLFLFSLVSLLLMKQIRKCEINVWDVYKIISFIRLVCVLC